MAKDRDDTSDEEEEEEEENENENKNEEIGVDGQIKTHHQENHILHHFITKHRYTPSQSRSKSHPMNHKTLSCRWNEQKLSSLMMILNLYMMTQTPNNQPLEH